MLTYDSGAGNGPFGLGWSLSLPSISRKTDRGLPRYQDERESDVFILSGAEDLVPVETAADATSPPGFRVHRYRPRVEGLFARIERWTAEGTGETHWRSISRDNVTTLYGYRLLLDKGMVFLQWKGTTDSLAAALNRLPPDWDVDGEATLYRVLLARLRGRPEEALTALDKSRYSVLRLSGKIVTPYAPTALLRAQIYDDLLGDSIRASEAYEAARAHLERAVSESREDPRLRIALGEAYAGLGRKSEAEHEAREAERLVPISRNLGQGASYVEGAARIFARVGKKEAALERLEQLVGLPYGVAVSRPRLRIDPTWDVLRDEPRFERLLQGGG